MGRAKRTRKEASQRNHARNGARLPCEGRRTPDLTTLQSAGIALPARRSLPTASPTHSVTCGAPCPLPRAHAHCEPPAVVSRAEPGASHRLLGGCFLWLSPPPPGGRGKLGGSGLEKARFWFGSAARYATCPLPGVWNLGAAGEIEAAWVGPGRAWQREDARVWGARRRPSTRTCLSGAPTGQRQRSISFSRAPSLPHPTPADASLLTAVEM